MSRVETLCEIRLAPASTVKIAINVRFFLAAVFAAIAVIGLLPGTPLLGAPAALGVAHLFLMGRSELTKPIPRREWSSTFLMLGVLVAVLLTLPFLNLHPAPPSDGVRLVLAAVLGPLLAWAIYRRWRIEKGKANA